MLQTQVKLLQKAGCSCPDPLIGHFPGKLKCKLCSTEAEVPLGMVNLEAINPEQRFGLDVTQADWEREVFKAASYFTLIVGRNPRTRSRFEFKDWEDVKESAKTFSHPMIYAVSATGHSTMLPENKWGKCDELWETRKQQER